MGGSMTTIRKYKENGNLLPQQQLIDFFSIISKEIVDLKVKAIKESWYFCITRCLPLPQIPSFVSRALTVTAYLDLD